MRPELQLSLAAPSVVTELFLSNEDEDVRAAVQAGTAAARAPSVVTELFLSNEDEDVRAAVQAGTAAARLCSPPQSQREEPDDEVRIALDGDAVVFSDASDLIYRQRKLEGFMEHERLHAEVPMEPGPFGTSSGTFRKCGPTLAAQTARAAFG